MPFGAGIFSEASPEDGGTSTSPRLSPHLAPSTPQNAEREKCSQRFWGRWLQDRLVNDAVCSVIGSRITGTFWRGKGKGGLRENYTG